MLIIIKPWRKEKMKFCTFIDGQGQIKVGVKVSECSVIEMRKYKDMIDLIASYADEKSNIQKAVEKAEIAHNFDDIKLKAPILNPGKMIFVGLNYFEHARESNIPIPEKPMLFAKFSNSIVGHAEEVIISRETSQCDYEAELAFIVGKKAKNIPESEALSYIAGYTICNDISARDLQFNEGGQWLRGKAVDTFAPLGPVIVTTDELTNPHNLSISSKVNGEIRQNSNTKELIFKVPFLLSFISRTITLEPGDLISTGTPSGVALGMVNPQWMKADDICEIEIEGIGLLSNKMLAE